ncbi:MAG: NADH-quinone oxidoreductase subunit H [Candidatus Aminicenantes bacterium]|nr:NADH-quinone oxidoreductase subunit H [Candidatus Aminicenantes bacterium]
MSETLVLLIKIVVVLAWFLVLALLLTWVERKQSAVMQDRIGANRARIFGLRMFGLFQPFADAIKMIFKEDFVPPFADKVLHTLAPFVSFFFVAVAVTTIPFGPTVRIGGTAIDLQVYDGSAGLLFLLAMLSLGVYGILLSGWSSRNRWGLIGGMRGAAQLISYEVGLGLSLVGLIMVYPSLRLSEIVAHQGALFLGFLPRWGVFLQPLGFLVFFITAIAETKRVPFDLPEGESEIIGFYAEYGGLKWGLFMLTDFMEIIVVAALATTLFFGGWQMPWLGPDGLNWPWGGHWKMASWVVVCLQIVSFQVKVAFFCWLQILIRWTYPRIRYDQLMDLGWKLLVPLGLLNILGTGLIMSLK